MTAQLSPDAAFAASARRDRSMDGQFFLAVVTTGIDGKPDMLARDADGRLLMYRGNGAGGWATGNAEQIGGGWAGFTALLHRRRLKR